MFVCTIDILLYMYARVHPPVLMAGGHVAGMQHPDIPLPMCGYFHRVQWHGASASRYSK